MNDLPGPSDSSPEPPPAPAPVVVTGANSGVGFETSRVLAASGAPILMVCRDEDRGRRAMERIRSTTPGADLTLVLCDLEDFDDVRRASSELAERAPTPGALVNNAGVYRSALERTSAGFERTLATNHLGPFLLTRLLEPRLRAAGARVVNVTSKAHESGALHRRPLDEILRGPDDYRGFGAYADSKLANVLFSLELRRRWGPEVATAAVHPGLLGTAIWDRNRTVAMWFIRRLKRFMGDPADGGRAVASVVTHENLDTTGTVYFARATPADPTLPPGADLLARDLWETSSRAVGLAP